jgi:hypothetical protein
VKPSPLILATSVVFVGTIAVLGVAIERQLAPSALPPVAGSGRPTTCFKESDGATKGLAVRTNDLPGTLAFSFSTGRSEYGVAELGYCFYTPAGAPNAQPIKCRGGTLRIAALDPSRALAGSYSFELENGRTMALQFTAPYCPSS